MEVLARKKFPLRIKLTRSRLPGGKIGFDTQTYIQGSHRQGFQRQSRAMRYNCHHAPRRKQWGSEMSKEREVIHRSIKGHWLHTTYCSLFLHLQSQLFHPTPDLMKGPFLWNRTHLEYENGLVYLSNGECLKSRRARYTAPVTFQTSKHPQ